MRSAKFIIAVGVVAVALAAVGFLYPHAGDTRSVGPVQLASLAEAPESKEFSRKDSRGLFVGISRFEHEETATVPYAVDDAVDLAYMFSLDGHCALIPPGQVVLALSGRPQKDTSQQKLRELRLAGARVAHATSGDIRNLLEKQANATGPDGVLVVSMATHGFINDEGDAHIVDSASKIGDATTSLRTSTLLDIAGRARRSLIFIDACRDRAGQTSRSASADPMTIAPHLNRLARYEGQAIFYAAAAGEVAYDDEINQNGVFTKAVLDGMRCAASSPRNTVTVQTLHKYVDKAVREWIEKYKNRSVAAATQLSVEGEMANAPVAKCIAEGQCHHVAVNDSVITVYDKYSKPLWKKDFAEPVVDADVADLDADSRSEVIVGHPDSLVVLECDAKVRWERSNPPLSLQTFVADDLFEKRTKQIVSIWSDDQASRLIVHDGEGNECSTYDHPGLLRHVAVGRPTKQFAPKIVAADVDSVFVLHARKTAQGPRWRYALVGSGDTIKRIRIADVNKDKREEISIDTRKGTTAFDFQDGILKSQPQWTKVQ